MTELSDQIARLRSDLEQRRAEFAHLEMFPERAAILPRFESEHVGKMRVRLQAEVSELERYITSLEQLINIGGKSQGQG